ncbi:hypothetical protein ACG1BZ_06210 [Microbulbifer sp. CNSA002]|uniref:hypothetical protein n=1 Tax=Microbulbifer sp. CNSA002 TaxID=3373604 RepID=UPI0039B58C71
MKWVKRSIFIIIVSIVGYLFFLHAGMASDGDEYLKWYYKIEFAIAIVCWWPVSIYLGIQELLDIGNTILGFEVWVIQALGYLIVFSLYERAKKHNSGVR